MVVSSRAVANKFLELAKSNEESLTNMQLQKLVFISQGYTLAFLDRPLYYNETYAWQFGPVIKELYETLRKYGNGVVKEILPSEDSLDQNSPKEKKIINAVWEGYGHFSGWELSAMTHKPHTPWSITWESDSFGIIPTPRIAEYYKGLLADT